MYMYNFLLKIGFELCRMVIVLNKKRTTTIKLSENKNPKIQFKNKLKIVILKINKIKNEV